MSNPDFDMNTYLRLSGHSLPKKIEDGSIEAQRDANRFTSPNLHRRIDPQEPSGDEIKPREYRLFIHNNDSYRLTCPQTHDEDSITSEVP